MNQPKIRIKVKDMGDMIAVLYPEKAPGWKTIMALPCGSVSS